MSPFSISVAYTAVNLLLAIIIYFKSDQKDLSKFYLFCICCLTAFGAVDHLLTAPLSDTVRSFLVPIVIFVFSMLPFFFLHFILIFLKRHEILQSKSIIIAIYFAGLFSYVIVLKGLAPTPVSTESGVSPAAYIFYLTWMSIFFSIGIALLYSSIELFSRRRVRYKLLFTGFTLLLLVLPGPFTQSLFLSIFHKNVEWYIFSSTLAIVIAVYIVFRYKIIAETPYETLKSALAVTQDVFIKTNENFQIEMVKGAGVSLLGYSEKDLIGRSLNEFVTQVHDIEAYRDSVCKETMKEATFDTEVICKTGDRLFMNLTFSPLLENKEILGFIVVARNITEQKHAAQLQSAVYRVAQAANTSATLDDLFREIHKIIGGVMPANNFYIALYDASKDVFRFPYFVDEVDIQPPQGPVGRGLTAYVLRAGKSLLCDEKFSEELARRGEAELVGAPSAIWLGVPLLVEEKSIGAMVVQHYSDPKAYTEREQRMLEFVSSEVARAIDRKQVENQIRIFAHAFESTTELISLTDLENRFTFVNRSFLEMYGYSEAEILGKQPDILGSPRNLPGIHSDILRYTLQGSWKGELVNRRKDGSEFPVFLTTSVIKDSEGNAIGYIGVAQDISEQKKLEGKLLQAQKLESIGTMAGGIAHDFNNILNIILGYVTLIERDYIEPEKLSQSVVAIKKATQRGADLVRQILTFARKTDVLLESVNVNETISDLTKMLTATFPETITFSLHLDRYIPSIKGDHTQLQQVLMNLCVNARDAMVDGGVLTISTEAVMGSKLKEKFPDVEKKEYICISVMDTGVGMDENTRSRIFEPFFTTKEHGSGTGLGLAVVYGVVKSHRGFIDVESSLGQGTKFRLHFPVQPHTVEPFEGQEEEVAEYIGGNETILLVEDEEMLLEMVKNMLEMIGYTILIAKNGLEAVEVYKEHKDQIAFVLSDMGLPKLGGFEAFLEMKKINPKVKAILASGYLDPSLRLGLLKAGAIDFVQKPYDPKQICKKIRQILDAGKK